MPPDSIVPTVISCSPNPPYGGQGAQFTVGFSGSQSTDQSFPISATSGGFSSLPSSVTLTAGHSQATFSATFAGSCPSSVTVTVGNGGQGQASITVNPGIQP